MQMGRFGTKNGSKMGQKTHYSKSDHAPFGMLKQMFLAHFEPVVTRFGPWKMPLGLEHGPFWDQQWVKKWSKTHVSKNDPAPFGKLKHVFLAHFEPMVTRFAPWKIPKCNANGPLWNQKWVKNRSKTHFSTSDPTPFGMHQQVVLAHFAPVLTRFGPWKMPKGLANGPFWDQEWVKNGSKTHFPKSDRAPWGMYQQVILAHFEDVVTCFGPWKIVKRLANGPFCDQKCVKNWVTNTFIQN